eukprot:5449269-Amphidinium_carterae.2
MRCRAAQSLVIAGMLVCVPTKRAMRCRAAQSLVTAGMLVCQRVKLCGAWQRNSFVTVGMLGRQGVEWTICNPAANNTLAQRIRVVASSLWFELTQYLDNIGTYSDSTHGLVAETGRSGRLHRGQHGGQVEVALLSQAHNLIGCSSYWNPCSSSIGLSFRTVLGASWELHHVVS